MKTYPQFFLLMFLFSILLINCKNSNSKSISATQSIKNYDLKELSERTTIKLSDLGTIEIQYIPLETSEQSIIPGVEKIICSKNYFLVQYYTNIKMFRYDGTFVKNIGIKGRGPNEFTVVHCIDINPESETIYLIDGWQQKFFVYSNKGDFIRSFKYPIRAAVNFKFTEDGILCYNQNHMGDMSTSFILIDTTGRILKKYRNKYLWTRTIPTFAFAYENIFYKNGTSIIKKEIYNDTLYAYVNKNFIPYSVIQIDENLRITPKVRSESEGTFIIENFINPWNLFEFGDYIFYEFSLPTNGKVERLFFIGSKTSNLRALFNAKDFINDIDGGPNIWPVTLINDGTIVSWIDAIDLKKFISSETFKNNIPKYPKKKKELEILAESLKDTDNPVLTLIKFSK